MVAKTFSAQVVAGQLRHQESLDAFEGQEVRVTVAAPSLPASDATLPMDSRDTEPPEWMAVETEVYVKMPFPGEVLKNAVIVDGEPMRPCVILPQESLDE
jgi:hypothetical protein